MHIVWVTQTVYDDWWINPSEYVIVTFEGAVGP